MRLESKHEEGFAVRVDVYLTKEDVRLKRTLMGLRVEIAECHNVAQPGAPALPRRLLHVALPEGMWPEQIRLREGERVALTDAATLVVPAQPLAPGMSRQQGGHPSGEACDEHGDSAEGQEKPEDSATDGCRCCRPKPQGGPWEDPGQREEPFQTPDFAPPNAQLYEAEARDRDGAKLSTVRMAGRVPLVAIDLRPVRYTERGQLELLTHIAIEIPYSPRPRERASDGELVAVLAKVGVQMDPRQLHPMPEPVVTSRAQANRYAELARSLVVNPDLVKIGPWTELVAQLPADYVVITDNRSWNAATITPIAPLAGDMVAQFERLAAHKRARGVTAKVVTITDIVNGRYGNHRAGARDLPEVLRNFAKHAHRNWGTAWLLLGGDVSVVPAREAAGAIEGHMDVAATDPPEANKSFWTGTFLKMHAVSPGTWWPGGTARQLVNAGTGQFIPYDATGATAGGGLGWYWTAADYTTRSTMATNFVRVNGAASVVNARLQWLYEWNRIPTDLYYASHQSWVIAWQEFSFWLFTLRLPYVYYPPHDWDALDNGVYGQYVGGADVDGVHWTTDLSVGRAPVQSGGEAQAFVDKAMAYGRIGAPLTAWNQSSWLERVVIAASNWGGGTRISRGVGSPPSSGQFHAGADATVLNLGSMPSTFDVQLIAEISDTDRRELPYNTHSNPSSRGWHFARSATDHAMAGFSLSIFGITLDFPLPSPWVVVHGAVVERDPPSYLFDAPGQDGSMADQEALRVQLAADLPGWGQVSRLYEDMTDLTPGQAVAAPVGYLTSTRLQTALNAAPHIVSLSGHGSPGGCCGGGTWMASALSNGLPGFIGYADSCLTGAMDSEDSFAEELLKNPNGGAVAYVGNTRFSWIGVGDDIQRAFFSKLRHTRHLGLLNDCRLGALDFGYWHAYARWIAMSLTLYGDPEMRVWRFAPRVIWPTVRWKKPDLRVPVEVELPRPPRPVEIGRDLPTHYWVNVSQEGGFERLERAEAGATLSLNVSGAKAGRLTVTVHADAPDYAPYERVFEVEGPYWLTGRVTRLTHGGDTHPWTGVDVRMADGRLRHWVVNGQALGSSEHGCEVIVQALLQAHTADVDIALQVDREGDGAQIEGFRLPA
ncbi:C25 family cysteine peptidase [Aquabacterium sp.]|uniref:C25 family cysteine peptidase n=1 Tax=Aquabacterium sp. TaxID=1872578 RepID=UPI002C463648|nr:C25 family cysteine peptidase [Aquabacterium sp.]HSW03797.1 C25 family cysteine peptidase [Aquabacterium sp.]